MTNQERIQRSLGTHDGTFHADEVTACGLLLLFDLIDRDKIVRTRDLEKLKKCEYVCDVGGEFRPEEKRYDHHQTDYRGDFSSAGMVWEDLKRRGIVDEPIYDFFNHSLIMGVDAHDNGRTIYAPGWATFSQIISNFVPPLYDAPSDVQNQAFFEALTFVEGHLRRLLERFRYIRSNREKVAAAMAKNEKFLLFEEPLPWLESFFDLGGEAHPALFVIMPSGGHWKLRAIPPTLEQRMKMRQPLPASWAGLSNSDLERVSGISGAVFCHKGRFISVWETKADVLKALEEVLK